MKSQDNTGDRAEECGPVHHRLDPNQMKCRCGLLTTVPFFTRSASLGSPETPQEDAPPVVRALEALEFAHGAIVDAIGLDDGLDGHAGAKVLRMIRAALMANGRTPPDWPDEDVAVEPLPIWSASIQTPAREDAATPVDLEPIKARVAAAAPGPWMLDHVDGAGGPPWILLDCREFALAELVANPATHEFIAAARTDVPALIAELERLRAQQPPSLLAASEGRVRALIGKWRRIAKQHAESDTGAAGVAVDYYVESCADELEAALAPLAEPPA